MRPILLASALLGVFAGTLRASEFSNVQPWQGRPQPGRALQEAFARGVVDASHVYRAEISRSSTLLLEGRVEEANQRLLDLVPPERCSAAHHYVLGNLLFRLDREESRKLHRRAFELRPEIRLVALEWALHQHRSERWKEAASLYRYYLSGGEDPGVRALLAECLLSLRKPEEAIAEWSRARLPENHTRVEEAVFWVHGPVHPASRRSDLLQEIRRGDLEVFESLIELDLFWDTDWWNVNVNDAYLSFDLEVAKDRLGADSHRYQVLCVVGDHCRPRSFEDGLTTALERLGIDPVDSLGPRKGVGSKRSFSEDLKRIGVLAEESRLPESSRMANLLFERMLDLEIVDFSWILSRFEEELKRRVSSPEGDLDAAKILAVVYREVGDDAGLAEIDSIGWKRYQRADFAGSALQSQGKRLGSELGLLQEALRVHPRDFRLRMLSLDCARRKGESVREPLVHAIQAGFIRMESAHRVHTLFGELDKELSR